MTESVIGGLVAILAAGMGTLGVVVGHLIRRLDRLEEGNRALWAYCRRLLDLYYKHRRSDAPDPDPLPDID